jgi:hypothetical protein
MNDLDTDAVACIIYKDFSTAALKPLIRAYSSLESVIC